MANFDSTNTARRNSMRDAFDLIDRVRALYLHAKEMQERLQRYQANTDATFTAAVNAVYTAAERQELSQMLQQVNTLVTDWEANHATAIGG
jgi:hypothetical protein